MDTPRSTPDRSSPADPPVPDPAAAERLATVLAEPADHHTMPRDPLAGELHLAVAALHRLGAGEPVNARLAEVLAPLYRALDALDGTLVEDAAPRALLEVVAEVDNAAALLERPDLRAVPTDQLAGRFRELYGGIVRLRGAAVRLHRAWRSAATIGVVDR
jgi:hypothetical protein